MLYCFTTVEHLKLNSELLLLWQCARLVKQSDSSISPLLIDYRCFCTKDQVVVAYFFLSQFEQTKCPRHLRHLKWYLGFNWVQDGTGGSNLFCERCLRKKFQKTTNWLTFSWIHSTSSYCTYHKHISSSIIFQHNIRSVIFMKTLKYLIPFPQKILSSPCTYEKPNKNCFLTAIYQFSML